MNRTRLIRDAALATGKTCIACGRDAVARVGDYPVCERHRFTVTPLAPDRRWKINVRGRHARVRMRRCAACGRARGLSRHHDWASGRPGKPPRPITLCRRCHLLAEGKAPRPS